MKYLPLLFCFAIISIIAAQTNTQFETPTQVQLDSLKTELETLFMKDQTFRRIYKEAEEKLGKDSEAYEYFWEVVEAQDSILEKQVLNIVGKYGWLGISQVGIKANAAQWAVLQHGSVASKEKYAPLLKESVLKAESQPAHYARFIDRMLINSDKPQLYGTQVTFDDTPAFFEIKEPELVNKRRKEIGLRYTIEEFAKARGLKWTIPQKQ